VIEAGDGAEALAEAPENLSLVVSDVIMPGLDGPALVRALREAQPGLPAILMSGYADSAQRAALAAQDIAFLAKPFGVPELVGLAEAQIGPEAASTKGEGEKSRPAETLFSG
jgi:two-component system cell cycle sensor histidine kinase/response regulator CckA